jgi:O-antigen ligase
MSQVNTVESLTGADTVRTRARIIPLLGGAVFYSLVALVVITAIPYGTAQPWWKAFFVCVIFALAILWIFESYLSDRLFGDAWPVVLPILALAGFAFLQTVPLGNASPGGLSLPVWNSVSADPYQTRFFALQLVALTLAGAFLFRYLNSERRVRLIINLIILSAVASALFGILRQTTPAALPIGLFVLRPGHGFAQFVNQSHFAFLMEMAFGLALGMIFGGAVNRERVLIYVAALLPIWTAIVVSGSRGGLVAMLAQVVIAALLFGALRKDQYAPESQARVLRIVQSLPVRLVLLVALVGGVIIGTVWLGGDRLAARIEQSRDEIAADLDESRQNVSRKEIWRVTWKMFAANPILGVGMGGYWAAVPKFHDASGRMTPQEAHNDYLELLASGGLVGVALAIWFAVVVFRRARENVGSRSRFRRAVVFGSLVGIAGVAVHSLFDFGLHLIVNALVFTTLIVIATSKTHWSKSITHEVE